MKVSSDSFMLAHNLFATAGIGSKSSTKDINEDTSLSQLIGYELYYEAVGATDADIAAVSDDDDDDDYTATKAHMVLYPGVGIPTSDTGGQVVFTGMVLLPQLQQEVMANRAKEQEIYDYYSSEAIVVRSEQLQRLSAVVAVAITVTAEVLLLLLLL
jgi:hypothetical protein